MTSSAATEWSVDELKRRFDAGEAPFVLDVRNRDEFESNPLESRRGFPTLNVPYFEILEGGGAEDLGESVRNYARKELEGKIPRKGPVVVFCAKGGTSAIVAEGLRSLGFPAVNVTGGMSSWGTMYETRVARTAGDLSVWQISRPARGCLSYMIGSAGAAVVIDPLRHFQHYLDLAREKGLRITAVLDTHGHADHLSSGVPLARAAGAPYFLHPYDAIHPMDVLPATIPYEPLRDGFSLSIGKSRLEALHIPGHTLGNMAFLLDRNTLFSGDSIFVASIARPDLGGRGEAWTPLHHKSLRRLMALPDDTLVLPGHAASPGEADEAGLFGARLGDLKRRNEGLVKAAGPEGEFLAYILGSLPKFPPQYVDIKRANIGLIAPAEEAADELELGKNVCALSRSH